MPGTRETLASRTLHLGISARDTRTMLAPAEGVMPSDDAATGAAVRGAPVLAVARGLPGHTAPRIPETHATRRE